MYFQSTRTVEDQAGGIFELCFPFVLKLLGAQLCKVLPPLPPF